MAILTNEATHEMATRARGFASMHWLEYWRAMTICGIDVSIGADGAPRFRKDGRTQRSGYKSPVPIAKLGWREVTCPDCLRALITREQASVTTVEEELKQRQDNLKVRLTRWGELDAEAKRG